MDAFRLEQLTGGTALQRVSRNRANLSAVDRQITKQLLEDIQNALSGH